VCYAFTVNEDLEYTSGDEVTAAMYQMTKVAALAYLMFNRFTPPCFAALGAMNAEIRDKKWFWGGIALQLSTGFTVGFLVYQVGTLLTTGQLGNGFVGGLSFVLVFAGVLAWLCVRADERK
jgi:ferrous iron transport protein B